MWKGKINFSDAETKQIIDLQENSLGKATSVKFDREAACSVLHNIKKWRKYQINRDSVDTLKFAKENDLLKAEKEYSELQKEYQRKLKEFNTSKLE